MPADGTNRLNDDAEQSALGASHFAKHVYRSRCGLIASRASRDENRAIPAITVC